MTSVGPASTSSWSRSARLGQGIGARRTLTYTDGSTIVERLEVLDDAAHRLNYALLSDTPFRDCLTTDRVWGEPGAV